MNKLVIIGIDGMDFNLYEKWKDQLPNLRVLEKEGFSCLLNSVYPPDSICAWTTIFTGKDPSEHGLLYTINYLNKNKQINIDNSAFKGYTFWDDASKQNKRVCILNPFLAYPAWEINGVMFSGPVFINGDVNSYPENEKNNYKVPEMGGIVDFPTEKTIKEFYNKAFKDTEQLADFGLEFYKKEKWDLFFITFLTLDRIKHFLWRYQDKNDPTYPGLNAMENSILDFYKLFDKIIGKILALIDNQTNIMIISDHGHQRRCYRILNLNEFLRHKGYLFSNFKKHYFYDYKFWIEKTKNIVLNNIAKYHLEDITSKLVKYIPRRTELKKSTLATNFYNSYAYTDTEFSGKNPSCGIRINKKALKNNSLDYETFTNQLINDIKAIIDTDNNKRIVNWVERREKIYTGKNIERFPDILIQLDDNYGVDFALFNGLFVNSVTHRKVSGGHTFNGVLFCNNKTYKKEKYNMIDVNPLIKSILSL